ncbi:hypothetical protein [Prevotella jejuni]|uniref:hypothetical protein n=1 Tax=Prevotella jejuni TaxID=1177574 RepID=UPI00352DB903
MMVTIAVGSSAKSLIISACRSLKFPMRRKRLAAFFSSCFRLKDRITEDRGRQGKEDRVTE